MGDSNPQTLDYSPSHLLMISIRYVNKPGPCRLRFRFSQVYLGIVLPRIYHRGKRQAGNHRRRSPRDRRRHVLAHNGTPIAYNSGMDNLYTYSEAAEALGLRGRSSVQRRMVSLADRGKPLTIEAGELAQFGARRLLTEIGLERLRSFVRGRAGRPPRAKSQQTETGVN